MRERRKVPGVYKWLGGRKNALGLLYAVLLTFAYYLLDAHDGTALNTYAMWLAVALLGTGALHVIEDTKRPTDAPGGDGS